MDGGSSGDDRPDRSEERAWLANDFWRDAVAAVVLPFSRPLWQNLSVPVVGVALWLGAFHAVVVASGAGAEIAAGTPAGRTARTSASVVANVSLGVFVGVATANAFGWAVWNVFLPGVLWQVGPQSYLLVSRRRVPEQVFAHEYVAPLGPNSWVVVNVFALVFTAMVAAALVIRRYDAAGKLWYLSMFADSGPMGENPWSR